ncbi:holo-ACP synthase [Tumebacillus lipolyticus]|uniref:Holo-[acyl-carrier-protein] synthase n=1 Tax=Tumebacillus lipolyticus TaxID=1280370 RepID=A0ABW5A1G8_9BACL
MIVGTGIDITELARIEGLLARLGDKAWRRILAPDERRSFSSPKRQVEYLAGRFAAKEAGAKALGTGLGKVGLHDLIITSSPSGAPTLSLSGHAAEVAEALGVTQIHLSISHSEQYAIAQVILEKTRT